MGHQGIIPMPPARAWCDCPRMTYHGTIRHRLLAVGVLLSLAGSAAATTCAAGRYRAGCVGPRGAVVARRGYGAPPAAVVVRRPIVVAPPPAVIVRRAPVVVAPVRCAIVNGARVCR